MSTTSRGMSLPCMFEHHYSVIEIDHILISWRILEHIIENELPDMYVFILP